MYREKTQGFPWLAKAYADYIYLRDNKIAKHLEYKLHPAPKAAQQVRAIASERRTAEQLYRALKYKLEYFENLFGKKVDVITKAGLENIRVKEVARNIERNLTYV